MNLADFDYELPEGAVAAEPCRERDAARLLVLPRERELSHRRFGELPALLPLRSLLVLNDTRVFPARLRGHKSSGGAAELLLVRRLDANTGAPVASVDSGEAGTPPASVESGEPFETWLALGKFGHPRPGVRLVFGGGLAAEIVARREDGSLLVRMTGMGRAGLFAALDAQGQIPLPPYIEAARRRLPTAPAVNDAVRYQTVFAGPVGAVAAPTAGLHFTPELLGALRTAGHEIATLTLHVGPGTFRPVETDDPAQHRMDAEVLSVPESTAAAVNRARREGRAVVAVGTTVVRALESAVGPDGQVAPTAGETALYVLPGFRFRAVTNLVTNFHLPRSTLLMLVAAFAGRERVLAAYREAVREGYRFYSYGDAMLIEGAAE